MPKQMLGNAKDHQAWAEAHCCCKKSPASQLCTPTTYHSSGASLITKYSTSDHKNGKQLHLLPSKERFSWTGWKVESAYFATWMSEAAGRGGVAQAQVSPGDKPFTFCKKVFIANHTLGYSSTKSWTHLVTHYSTTLPAPLLPGFPLPFSYWLIDFLTH